MTPIQQTIAAMDALVDTYTSGEHSAPDIIKMRRELSGHLYHLASYVKATYAQAIVSYARRKRIVAMESLAALQQDSRKPMNKAQVQAEATNAVMEAQMEQAESEGTKESIKAKMIAAKEVLQSMSSEVSYLRAELEKTYYQSHHA